MHEGANRLVRPGGCAHEVEVAQTLIARVKAADSSINRRDELWYELPKPTSPTCSCRGRRRPAA
eukprot:scaffold64474_cov79-Phaeocystis_antarctica.AAC.1